MFQRIKEYQFLFEELTKRDFRKKYKRTILGVFWSVLSPLLTLLVMQIVFTRFFGGNIAHYTTYLFAGNIIFSYFTEATNGGMTALVSNKDIFSKINVPKYMFVLSTNFSTLLNFVLSLLVFFLFAALDAVVFRWSFLLLLYPTICLFVFNIGVSMILSAFNLFFSDTSYLYRIFTMLLMYASAIFYSVDSFPANVQRVFLINPVYTYIKFFRIIVIDGNIPSLSYFLLCGFYAALMLFIGVVIYKRYNDRFMYYV